MNELTETELGFLVWCAAGYDRRLPNGYVPARIWDMLTPQWQMRINLRNNSDYDEFGAQVRKP